MFAQKAAHAARFIVLAAVTAVVLALGASSSVRADSPAPPTLTIAPDQVVGGNSVQATVTVPPLVSCESLTALGEDSTVCQTVVFDDTVTVALQVGTPCSTPLCAEVEAHLPAELGAGLGTPVVTLPTSIQVERGQSETFTITTAPVSTEQDVTISATADDATAQATLTVIAAPPQLQSIDLDPTTMYWLAVSTLAVKVCLDNPAPADTPVGVGATGGPNVNGWMAAIAPADINGFSIPSGSTCGTGYYNIDPGTWGGGNLNFTATVYAILNGTRKNATLTFVKSDGTGSGAGSSPTPGQFSISFDPANITMDAGQPQTTKVTITLPSAAPSGGAAVNISEQSPAASGNESVAIGPYPSRVTVAANQTSTSFAWTINGCDEVTGGSPTCTAKLTASYNGATASATLNITCDGCQSSASRAVPGAATADIDASGLRATPAALVAVP